MNANDTQEVLIEEWELNKVSITDQEIEKGVCRDCGKFVYNIGYILFSCISITGLSVIIWVLDN